MRQSLEQQQTATTAEKNHGRIERRTVTTTTATIDDGDLDWPGARQLIRLDRHTQMANGTLRESTTYAITACLAIVPMPRFCCRANARAG